MLKLAALAAAAALAGVAVGVAATQLGGDAVRAVDTAVAPQQAAAEPRPAATTAAKQKVAVPSAAQRRAANCPSDEQSDSRSDNRDPALSGNDCPSSKTADENDPSGSDGPGPADETGPDEAAGPDDGGNGP